MNNNTRAIHIIYFHNFNKKIRWHINSTLYGQYFHHMNETSIVSHGRIN